METSQHQPLPRGNDGHRWSPTKDGVGGAATTNPVLLASPATSLEQPKNQPRICQPVAKLLVTMKRFT